MRIATCAVFSGFVTPRQLSKRGAIDAREAFIDASLAVGKTKRGKGTKIMAVVQLKAGMEGRAEVAIRVSGRSNSPPWWLTESYHRRRPHALLPSCGPQLVQGDRGWLAEDTPGAEERYTVDPDWLKFDKLQKLSPRGRG